MKELKNYKTDPTKNHGWSFDMKLLHELSKKTFEEGWNLDTEQIDTILKVLENKFPSLPSPCTPMQYKEITRKDWPNNCLVWAQYDSILGWDYFSYSEALNDIKNLDEGEIYLLAIVQTGQPAPDKDWRPE